MGFHFDEQRRDTATPTNPNPLNTGIRLYFYTFFICLRLKSA